MDNHNIEVEQNIIGALIKDPTHSNSRETLDSLDVNDFYVLAHRHIFNTIKKMSEKRKKIDLPLVEEELEKVDFDCGGFIYLAEITKASFGVSNLSGYVGVVKSLARKRDLNMALIGATDMLKEKASAVDIIEKISNDLHDISINSNGKELEHIKNATGNWLDLLDRRAAAGGGILGVKTGIDELDERLNGIDEESLVVVAGRPSMGKTLFCQCLAQNIGVDQGKNNMFFSMEMSATQLYERFISGLSNVSAIDLRRANMNTENQARIHHAVTLLDNSGIYFCEEPNQSVGQIRSKVRRHKNKFPDLKMIMIDYLGLMKLGKADRHDIAVGDVTRSLKELAKEMKVPVILIAQANRGLDKATRPAMSNIKDSSSIEADADLIMFVHREEVVNPDTELKGVTELIIAKDRHNDANGTVFLEKVHGKFISMGTEQVAMLQHKEDIKNTPIRASKGFENK